MANQWSLHRISVFAANKKVGFIMCSTCLSSGLGACTRAFCIDRCYQRPVVGRDCREAPPTRYYYDPSTSLCINFTARCERPTTMDLDEREIGNEFDTPRECYDRCNPRSELLLQ